MKYHWNFVKLFCFGFMLAAVFNLTPSCSENESPTQPNDHNSSEYYESQDLKNLLDSLITAFKSENKSKVLNCINEEFIETYTPILNNSTASLSAFGTALETRKLVFSNSLYAEYEISVNENTYTIAYANCGEDKWQLVRF